MFKTIDAYFKFHSKIYDLTRWSILFGRKSIFTHLPNLPNKELNVLDIGCGTGMHLQILARRYPKANITGLDASKEMLNKAGCKTIGNKQIELVHSPLEDFIQTKQNYYDLIFCSYSLSMIEETSNCISTIYDSLKENGCIVVVDFNSTPLKTFEKWMSFNHVQISGNLFKVLNKYFKPQFVKNKKGYIGLWKYSLFVGTK